MEIPSQIRIRRSSLSLQRAHTPMGRQEDRQLEFNYSCRYLQEGRAVTGGGHLTADWGKSE